MKLQGCTVPITGKFRVGNWDGREYAWTQRQRLPALYCFIFAVAIGFWGVSGWIWPRADVVLEGSLQTNALIASGLMGVLGVLMLLLSKRWRIVPSEGVISCVRYPLKLKREVRAGPGGLWVAIHPVSIHMYQDSGWSGAGVVVHASETEGVIIATVSGEGSQALQIAEEFSSQTGVKLRPGLFALITAKTG